MAATYARSPALISPGERFGPSTHIRTLASAADAKSPPSNAPSTSAQPARVASDHGQPGKPGAINTRRSTRSGRCNANSSATWPPSELPTTATGRRPPLRHPADARTAKRATGAFRTHGDRARSPDSQLLPVPRSGVATYGGPQHRHGATRRRPSCVHPRPLANRSQLTPATEHPRRLTSRTQCQAAAALSGSGPTLEKAAAGSIHEWRREADLPSVVSQSPSRRPPSVTGSELGSLPVAPP
jgi:hypothetical protein